MILPAVSNESGSYWPELTLACTAVAAADAAGDNTT